MLLHGFPTSSLSYRSLLDKLSDCFYVVAPDVPGFGFTIPPGGYEFTFDNLAKSVEQFVDKIGLNKFGLYIFDYGAPWGMRQVEASLEEESQGV